MRTLWTGAISFGLIHIPVKLYSATQSRTLDNVRKPGGIATSAGYLVGNKSKKTFRRLEKEVSSGRI